MESSAPLGGRPGSCLKQPPWGIQTFISQRQGGNFAKTCYIYQRLVHPKKHHTELPAETTAYPLASHPVGSIVNSKIIVPYSIYRPAKVYYRYDLKPRDLLDFTC
ncbi:Flavin oxidoreductase hxnT [Fusarium oxysporum f. sp. albedinis]|nr:Flavin oxidoreductase hxnT [Fusarium oxysporum f. sp. albedinis]